MLKSALYLSLPIPSNRMFSTKCLRCGDRVQPNDMVMRAQNYVFHLTCFVCCVCCQPLQKGEQFILRGGQLFCRHDFEKDMYLSQHQCPEDEFLMDEMRPRDGRRGPKRPRTILTSSQRRQFKASFEMSPKPCRKIREALAKDTGLSVRVVQVWFQNQRAKMKKIQRKSKQDGDKTSDKDSSKDDKGWLRIPVRQQAVPCRIAGTPARICNVFKTNSLSLRAQISWAIRMTASAARTFRLTAATLIIWTRPHPTHCRCRTWICMQRTYTTICSTMQQLRPIRPPRETSIQSINFILCKTHISIRSNEIEAVCRLRNMLNGSDSEARRWALAFFLGASSAATYSYVYDV